MLQGRLQTNLITNGFATNVNDLQRLTASRLATKHTHTTSQPRQRNAASQRHNTPQTYTINATSAATKRNTVHHANIHNTRHQIMAGPQILNTSYPRLKSRPQQTTLPRLGKPVSRKRLVPVRRHRPVNDLPRPVNCLPNCLNCLKLSQ